MNGKMEETSQPQVWPQDDVSQLLESMKSALPQKDLAKYKRSVTHLDWDKLAFNSYTGEMCKLKWLEVAKEIRKFRTLTEVILEAQDYIQNPYKGKRLKLQQQLPPSSGSVEKSVKKHPDFPKKPLTPYFRFFMETQPKLEKLHPEMSHEEIRKMLTTKYRALPDQNKTKYTEEFLKEREVYEHSLKRFREENPELAHRIPSKRPKRSRGGQNTSTAV
ncbi:nucleolar transcription factor 1-like isoform 2-T6 [Syngnathus typhle]